MGKPHDSAPPVAETTVQAEDLGGQLRKAREACQLSIPSAAASLHLPPRVIAALEANDFGQFEPVYVRGYLRNYARLLNLVAEPLLESYNRTLAQDSPPPPPPPPDYARAKLHRKLVFAPMALLALALLLWGAGRLLLAPSQEADTPPTAAVLPPPSGDARPATIALPGQAQEPPKSPAEIPAPPQPAQAATAPPPSAAEPPRKPQEAAAAPPEPAPPSKPPVGQGPDTVTLRLSASAWVAIQDRTGNRLAYATLPAGSEQTYSGQGPFTVVLGNAPAATLSLNGQPFELPKSKKSGTVLRFTLGR